MASEICSLTSIIGEFQANDKSYMAYILPDMSISTPHIHIGDAQTFPMCYRFHCIISLVSPNYISNSCSNNNILTEKQSEGFISFISSVDEDGDEIWRYTLKTWNMNNQNYTIPIDSTIPDYKCLATYN